MDAERRGRVLFMAPVPPPLHGGALAMKYLLPLRDAGILEHINAQFADDLGGLGRFSLRKLGRLVIYSFRFVAAVLRGGVRTAVLTPTCYLGPFLKDAVFIWLSSAVCRRRTVAWLHMDFRMMRYEERPWILRQFIRWTMLRCDRFVVVSGGLRSILPGWIPAGAVDAIANGVDAPEPFPAGRTGDGRIRVLYLSNLEQGKGWRVLLAVARTLCLEFPSVEFVFRGNPALQESREGIAAEFAGTDCDGRVRYEGPAYDAEKWQALADADIYCFPSLHEAFPLSILEAMAAGLPVVASRVGAVGDAIIDGSGGELVAPGEGSDLEAALRKLILDDLLRARMGSFNRQRFLENYTLSAYTQRWLDWLERDAIAVG